MPFISCPGPNNSFKGMPLRGTPFNSGVRLTKLFALIPLLLAAGAADAHDLAPVDNPELATVLGLAQELATTSSEQGQPYIVRVYAAPTSVMDCGGTVASCPDIRLLVTVAHGDSGETPALYQLPVQKGWEFLGWTTPSSTGGAPTTIFTVRSTLPETNLEVEAREAWRPREYRVTVSPESASYVLL